MQHLSLYASFVFSMLLNGNIANIEKVDDIYSLTFVTDEFSELFLHPSIFSINDSRSE